MSISTITTDDLRCMESKEGLILMGCGGDLQEWVDGINEMFTESEILKGGSRFEDVSAFQYDGMTWILENLPCGVCRPMRISAVHGCPILYPTVWAALSENLCRNRRNRIAL